MFCKLFIIVDVVELESYKIAWKIIDDLCNIYSLHCQVKLKSTLLHINEKCMKDITFLHPLS